MTVDASFHAGRRNTIGASDVAKILGISPFGSKLDVYKYKLGLSDGMAISTEKTERGHRQEEMVLREFASAHQCEVRNEQLRVVHPENEWASATLDGMAYRGISCLGPVEAKTISTKLYITVPEYYLIQVLWQCWVTDQPSGHLAVWSTKEQSFQSYPIFVANHQDFLNDAIVQCRDFWFGHVIPQVPPAPPQRREREDGETPWDLCEQYLDLTEKIKELTNARSEVQNQIYDFFEYRDEIHIDDGSYRVDVAKGRMTIRRASLRP